MNRNNAFVEGRLVSWAFLPTPTTKPFAWEAPLRSISLMVQR